MQKLEYLTRTIKANILQKSCSTKFIKVTWQIMNLAAIPRVIRLPSFSSASGSILKIRSCGLGFSARISELGQLQFSTSPVVRSRISEGIGGYCWSKPSFLLGPTTIYSQPKPKNHGVFTIARLSHTSGGNENELQGGNDRILPPLMPFQPVVWPRFVNAIRNWFFINFIIKPYFDKEFSMMEFIAGAKEVRALL